MPIIEVDHVTKEFQLGQLHSLKQTALNGLRRLTGQAVEERKPFTALNDVNFTVEEGEVLGIIGHNGAGKSTLLKLLANISKPTRGKIKVKDRVAPLIEVGAGLIGDLTGRENIYLNGTLLGMSRQEIKRKFDDIVSFAELEEFIDTPIKRYSSGMQVRLGFSIATSVDAGILIVDEVLAVGDLAFQRKCFDRMEDLIKRKDKTVLIVSHNIRQLEQLCDRVIMFDHGRIVADGNPTAVSNQFFEYSNTKIKANTSATERQIRASEELAFDKVEIRDRNNHTTEKIDCLSPFSIHLTFTANQELDRICFLIGIHTTDFVYLTANNNVEAPINFPKGQHRVDVHFDSMNLLPGVYSIRAWIGTPEGRESFYGENLCSFQVFSEDHLITRQQEMGLFYMKSKFEIKSPVVVAN